MTIAKQHLQVEAATNCLTRAEDRIATALSKSPSWQVMTGTANEAEASQLIWLDEVNQPEDNLAFTLEEIELRGTAATVLADPEAASTMVYGSAGQILLAMQILLIIERFIPSSPDNNGVNQLRRIKNHAVNIQLEICEYLRTQYGPLWLQGCVMQNPEPIVEQDEEVVLGERQQCIFVMDIGSGEED